MEGYRITPYYNNVGTIPKDAHNSIVTVVCDKHRMLNKE